ncbi:MAG: FeoA domain [Verrucomicrobiota bacterium]|jgi:Fe2+ transport system protein FeoA
MGFRSYGPGTLTAVASESGGTSETGSDTQLAPLNRVRAGCVVIIKRLTAAPEVNQRLREMGFGEEQRVKVITLQNNVLCQVCNARLGLSAKLAESILVQPVGPMRLAA